jgi:type II secretory pathway predicted ATPase ExeA
MIACTFLLSLVKDGNDSSTTLLTSLQKTVRGNPSSETIKDILDKLQARGGQEQLIMFLTGPAGSGKSTAVRVAEQFCYEFCLAVGIMWSDTTFLFTAYIGAAALLIDGTTISRTAYLNQKRPICDDDIKEWNDVQILVIDEVSFMGDNTLQMLNKKLTNI